MGFQLTALSTIAEIKTTTLIFVHSSVLMKQWENRIQAFLPGAKVGIIRQKVKEVEGKDIVIAMLQTLLSKPEESEHLCRSFGYVIIDEAHHMNAQVFSSLLPYVSSRHMLMLSGTPYKKDGTHLVLEHWVGPITFQIQKNYKNPVTVQCEYPEYDHPKEKTNRIGKLNLAKMMTELCLIDKRNQVIVTVLKQCIEMSTDTSKRGILVLSERIDHLNIMDRELKKLCPHINTLIFTRTTPVKIRDSLDKESGNYNIIFSTYHMVSEGLDLKTLSILVFATPRANVVQATNRIMRGNDMEYNPLIVDFIDKWSMWEKYWFSRRRYYVSQKFYIGNTNTENKEEENQEETADSREPTIRKRKVNQCPFAATKKKC